MCYQRSFLMRLIILMVLLGAPAVLSLECRPINPKPDFDIKQMAGWWYLHYKTEYLPGAGIDYDFKCFMQYWEPKPDGNVFMAEAYLPKDHRTSDGGSFMAIGYKNSTVGEIAFEVWNNGTSEIGPLLIIDTDYTNFLVSTHCFKGNMQMWVLTRNGEKVDSKVIESIKATLKLADVTIDQLEESSHSQCP